MSLERLHPAPSAPIDVDDRAALLDLYRPPRPDWLRLNLIATVTGGASGSDGTSETLTNPVDRRLLGVIRELADVVLIGAATLRAEGYLHPRRSRLAVITLSGDLSGHRIDAPDGSAPLVICPAAAVDRALGHIPGAEVVVLEAEEDGIPVAAVIAALRDRGLNSIVCEGGPSLAAQVVASGLADEFCLSTAARVGGAVLPVTGAKPIAERPVSLALLLRDAEDALYARWLFADR